MVTAVRNRPSPGDSPFDALSHGVASMRECDSWRLRSLQVSDYTHAESPKPSPEVPVRVFLKSQLMAALRQHSRPIVIEDPDLALPFTRMLRARELRLKSVGGLVAEAMSYAIRRHYSADVEAHWYIGQYVLPGNVQRIILKPKVLRLHTLGSGLSAHSPRYRQ